MPASSDLFLSYPHKEQEHARDLAAALRAEGLTVWMDESDVGAFEHIHDRVAGGIAGSRALLAWYSRHYAASRPCQWELSAAWLCEGGGRILVVNPEADDEHIRPRSLLNRAYLGAGDLAAVARRVKAHLARFASSIGDAVSFSQPLHYGRQLTGSNRFLGRNEHFWSIHDALSESGAAMLTGAARSVVQLRGFGGVGKSVLAEEYALRFGAAYPGGLFWLKAYGNDAAGASMPPEDREGERIRQVREFAAQLHIPTEGRQPAEIKAALAKFFGSADRRSLWIVDDLPSGLTDDDLSNWLSPHASVPTLITTRDRRHSSRGRLVDVDVLSPEESFALLETHRRVGDSERRAARELLDALGHHALAVEITGSFLADQQSVSFEEFLAELRDPGEDVLEQAAELADALPLDHSPSIVATLQGTIRQLGGPARDLLCLASCLAPAPIPKELIESVFARLYETGSPSFGRMKAAKETDRFSLSRKESTPPDALSVHTIVARTARRHPDSKERLGSIRAAAVASLTETVRRLSFSLGAILRQSLLITHARALSASPTTAEEALLLVLVANTDLNRGDLETAERLANHALDYCRAALGEDSLETCYARSGVAMVLLARGDSDGARAILEAVAPVFERALPAGDIFRVGAQIGLALAAAGQGDLESAGRLAEAALSASADSNGPDHPVTLGAKSVLAQIFRARGDLRGAARLQQEVFDARRRIVNELDMDGLTDEFVMAQTKLGSGEIESAAPVIEKAAESFARELGEENLLTLNAKFMLLLLLIGRGDAPAARRLAGEVVPRFAQTFGPREPATLLARWAEAEALVLDGDVSAGLPLLEGVVPELEAAFGADHPEVLSVKVSLADARHSAGDPEGARRILDDVIPRAEARLGPAHLTTLNAKSFLAHCLHALGDRAGACQVWAELAALREALQGAGDPEVLTLKLLVAQMLVQLGQHQGARQLLRQTIPLAESRLGPEHQTTLMLKECLAYCQASAPPADA